jgi:hypothetical protein
MEGQRSAVLGGGNMQRTLCVTLLVAATSGCAVGNSSLRSVAVGDLQPGAAAAVVAPVVDFDAKRAITDAAATAKKLAPAASYVSDCELRLFAEQLPTANSQGIADGAMGSFIVERVVDSTGVAGPPTAISGVCIKHAGQALKLPSAILIATDPKGPSLSPRFCAREPDDYALIPPAGTQIDKQVPNSAVKIQACTWDGTFHSTRPFTFTLATQPGFAVGDYVEAFRVYRNGDLMAAWNYASDSPQPDRVVIDGRLMKTGAFAATYPPHLASMDLRVVPRNKGVTHVVDLETRDDSARFQARLGTAVRAAGNVVLPPGSPERASLDCLASQFESAKQTIMSVVDQVPTLPASCAPLIKAGGAAPLSTAYRDVKNQSQAQLEGLQAKADATIVAYRAAVLATFPPAVGRVLRDVYSGIASNLPPAQKAAADAIILACIGRAGTTSSDAECLRQLYGLPGVASVIDPLMQTAIVLDQDMTTLLQTVDEARLLAERLRDRGKEILNNPDTQGEVFKAFTASLQTQADPFEPRKENPPLIPSEQRIEMQYSDAVQGFLLAPWNAVPLRLKNEVEADFNAAVAVPMLDAGGVRIQWGRSRFAEVRGAVGIGFIQTEEAGTNTKRGTWLPHASLGVGTFKVGLGYAVNEHIGDRGVERLRLLVGADLFKLISGANVEAR